MSDAAKKFEEILEQYATYRRLIGGFFKMDEMWHNAVLMTDEAWTDYGEQHGEVGWDLKNDEFQYSVEVYGTSRWENGDYVMFCANDCSGNRDFYIFKLSNKIEE